MNSKRKGKTGELEAAHELHRVFGVDARRGVQYAGGMDSPDVIGLPGVHIEVKRTERLNLYDAMAQAVSDAGSNVPVVLHRRNHGAWLAIVRLDDLPELVERLASLPQAARPPDGTQADVRGAGTGEEGATVNHLERLGSMW